MKRIWPFCLLLLCSSAVAQTNTSMIPQLATAATLTGAEQIPLWQNSDMVQATLALISAFVTTNGVTCSGSPTSSFASTNGIVIHC